MELINLKFGLKFLTKKNYQIAVLLLLIASVFWGLSFTFVRWALKDFNTSSLLFWRFLIAFLISEVLLFLFQRESYRSSHSDLKFSFLAGLALALSILTQTYGLNFTSATNSSFITSLYVVLLPFISWFFFRKKIHWYHFVLGITAFGGMMLLLNIAQNGLLQLGRGELFTFFCAVASTFHIIFVGLAATKTKNAFRFNTFQSFWAWLLISPYFFYELTTKATPIWPKETHPTSLIGLLGLVLLVSMTSFYLQVKAQKVLNPATASMLCLLEAPNAFLAAFLFLGETLAPIQVAGVSIILVSSALSVFIDRPKN